MDESRYLQTLQDDTEMLISATDYGLQQPVPCCPGWSVAHVVVQATSHRVGKFGRLK